MTRDGHSAKKETSPQPPPRLSNQSQQQKLALPWSLKRIRNCQAWTNLRYRFTEWDLKNVAGAFLKERFMLIITNNDNPCTSLPWPKAQNIIFPAKLAIIVRNEFAGNCQLTLEEVQSEAAGQAARREAVAQKNPSSLLSYYSLLYSSTKTWKSKTAVYTKE